MFISRLAVVVVASLLAPANLAASAAVDRSGLSARSPTGSRADVHLADGRRLSYLRWAAPGKPILLLLHGRGGNASGFEPLAEHLAQRFDIFAIDMAGCGFSDWRDDGDYSLEASVQDVAEFVRIMRWNQFGIFGSSYGAPVGLTYAAANSAKVKYLILDDGGPTALPNGSVTPLNPGQTSPAGAPAPRPTPLHFANWPEAQQWQQRTCRFDCTPDELESQFVRTPTGVVQRNDVVGLWGSARGTGFTNQWPSVRALRMPTFLLRAERGLVPFGIAQAMAVENPRLHFVTIRGASHTTARTQPQSAYVELDKFLEPFG